MWYLNPKVWIGFIGVLIVAGLCYLSYDYGRLDSEKAYNALKSEVEEAYRLAQKQVRQIENDLKESADKDAQENRRKLNEVQANADAATGELARVQKLYRAALSRISKPAAPVLGSPSQPSTDPLDMFVDLYTRSEERNIEIGKYADQLKISGLLCEKRYDEAKTLLDSKR